MMKYLQKVLLILFTLTLTAITGSASAEVTYFHHDAQGSTIAATSETGSVLWRESYEPYGERLDKAVSTNDHATYYTGKPHDDRTGLTYFGARHYDPVVGRFMGIDPVGVNPNDPRTFNRYAYAANNPYKYVDPDGRAFMFAPAIIPFLGGSTAAGGAAAAGSSTAGLLGGLLGIGIGTGGWLWYNNDNSNTDDSSESDGRDTKRKYTKKDRKKMYEDADGTCEYCGDDITMDPGTGKSMEGDHIDPWVDGGQTDAENGAAACRDCNRSKGSKKLGTEQGQFTPSNPNQRIRDRMR
ncbi:MAG: RHS repeat-associated core domain-containing protein [Candidatus Thiodiazotropha lotti]|nr:HNH endonuclease [Candidatus Thiodiazotropha lotti]MCW4216027.1 HNH endonuclease [Candidatus Thiodiazotropha lotti]